MLWHTSHVFTRELRGTAPHMFAFSLHLYIVGSTSHSISTQQVQGDCLSFQEFVILFWFLASSAQTMWMVGRKCPTTFDTCRVGTHTFIYGPCPHSSLLFWSVPIFVASLNFLKNLFWWLFYRVVSVWWKWTVRNSSFDVNTAIINSLQSPNLQAKIHPQHLNVKVFWNICEWKKRVMFSFFFEK